MKKIVDHGSFHFIAGNELKAFPRGHLFKPSPYLILLDFSEWIRTSIFNTVQPM
jgi:hypothetical protein